MGLIRITSEEDDNGQNYLRSRQDWSNFFVEGGENFKNSCKGKQSLYKVVY